MLAIIGDYPEFRRAVKLVIRDVSFDKDVVVSVFESTIRVLGGLLSAHQLASDPVYAIMPEYNGELLELANELGWRLLPAFNTTTGLPYHRVHLQHGVLPDEPRETCTAAAGTLVLEFGLLSRLTGQPVFERLARRSLQALWDRRSKYDLVGTNIDVQTGVWKNPFSAVGAGVDSFFEYLLKSYIALDDPVLLDMFVTARKAVTQHLMHEDVHLESNMHMGYGISRHPYVSALQAFWPGLEALAGNPHNGTRMLRPLLQLWRRYQAMPEMFDVMSMSPIHFAKDSPLRPELVESLYLVYCITRHPSLLNAAAEIIKSINTYSRVKCGYASIADVISKRLDDRMDSYFLSETAKYLFLLFDASLMPHGHIAMYANRSELSDSVFPWRYAHAFNARGPEYCDVIDGKVSGNCSCEPAVAAEPASTEVHTVRDGISGLSFTAVGSSADIPPRVRVPTDKSVQWAMLSMEHRYASQVRNNRSAIPALPFSSLQSLFTTEGHLFLLKARAFDVYKTFVPDPGSSSPRLRSQRRRRFQITPEANLSSHPLMGRTQSSCHVPIDGWKDAFVGMHGKSSSVGVDAVDFTQPQLPDDVLECPAFELMAGDSDGSSDVGDANSSDGDRQRGETDGVVVDWDVTSRRPADAYLRPAAESLLARVNAKASQQQQQRSQSSSQQQADGQCPAHGGERQDSELTVELDVDARVFKATVWSGVSAFVSLFICVSHMLCGVDTVLLLGSQDVLFPATLLADELNKHLGMLLAARVASVTLKCVNGACNAMMALLPLAPAYIQMRSGTSGLSFNYTGCPAAFGPSLQPLGSSDAPLPPAKVVIASPMSACGPVQLLSSRVYDDAAAESQPPVVALVARGHCSFVTKVRHAQQAGASGVIIVDFQDSGRSDMEPHVFSMADDQTGQDIGVVSAGIRHNALANNSTDSRGFVCDLGLRFSACEHVNSGQCSCEAAIEAVSHNHNAHRRNIEFAVDDVTVELFGSEASEFASDSETRVTADHAINVITEIIGRVLKK